MELKNSMALDPFYFGDTLALANVEFLGGQIVKGELRIAVN